MVNNPINVWILSGLVPPQNITVANRKIQNGPVYDLDVVKQLIVEHGFFVINEDARTDAETQFSTPMTADDIKSVLLSLRKELYHLSQWVLTSANQKLQCDAYLIKWNRNRRCEWEHGTKLYIKFGFCLNSPKCLIVSFHPALY